MSNLNLKTAGIKPCRKSPPNQLLPYLSRWQSNDNIKSLGICNFLFDLYNVNLKLEVKPFLKDFKPEFGVAPWARVSLYHYYKFEPGMTVEDRCFLIETYRGSSKTTWFAFVQPLYETLVGQYGIYFGNTLFPEYDYQLIRCKNRNEAIKRLNNISAALNRASVHYFFGDLKPSFQEVKSKEAKDSGGILILSNGYAFEASGITMPARGANLYGGRLDKVTFDDVQNKENTKTSERRQDTDREVLEETIPAVTDEGSIVYICNRVHPDDTASKIRQSKGWRKFFFTLTVKKHEGRVYPGIGDLDKEIPEWSQRYTIERIKKKKDWWESQPLLGGLKGFLKEHYNVIKSDTEYRIKFHDCEYIRAFGINWLKFRDENGNEEIFNVRIIVGNDPAISQRKESSDSVINVTAFDYRKRRYVLHQSVGKFDIHDRFHNPDYVPANGIVAITPDELALIKRKGSTEEIIRQILRFNADGVVIETAGQQSTFFNEFVSMADRLGLQNVIKMPYPGGAENKTDKNRDQLLCFVEAGLYYFDKKLTELQSIINAFPSCKQDRLDAMRLAERLAAFPPLVKFNPLGIFEEKSTKNEFRQDEFVSPNKVNDYEPWVVF